MSQLPQSPGLCECGCGLPAPRAKQRKGAIMKGMPLRFIRGHHQRKPPGDDSWKNDFWKRVEKQPGGCWLWTGAKTAGGYGFFQVNRRPKPWVKVASKLAYELLVGSVPVGYTVDHVKERCTNTLCVNPAHLEAVPHRINLLRGNTVNAANAAKTHCDRGHPFAGDNLFITIVRYGAAAPAGGQVR